MIFTWIPDANISNSPKDRVTKIEFGDGYAQRIRNGINTKADSWSLTFSNRNETEGKEIVYFLKSCSGTVVFDWTAPGDTLPKRWICEAGAYSFKIGKGNIYSISAKFDEVFE